MCVIRPRFEPVNIADIDKFDELCVSWLQWKPKK
jgi:hypothetical protein